MRCCRHSACFVCALRGGRRAVHRLSWRKGLLAREAFHYKEHPANQQVAAGRQLQGSLGAARVPPPKLPCMQGLLACMRVEGQLRTSVQAVAMPHVGRCTSGQLGLRSATAALTRCASRCALQIAGGGAPAQWRDRAPDPRRRASAHTKMGVWRRGHPLQPQASRCGLRPHSRLPPSPTPKHPLVAVAWPMVWAAATPACLGLLTLLPAWVLRVIGLRAGHQPLSALACPPPSEPA
jgi:hypothetical protein